jgi:hypothetical protein
MSIRPEARRPIRFFAATALVPLLVVDLAGTANAGGLYLEEFATDSTAQFDKTDSPINNGGNGGGQGGFIPMLGSGYSHKLHDRVRLGVGVFSVAGAALDPDNSWRETFS